jgi:glyoxylase-like metal-dependent hydrolase (beta-lactamase superfamily II)
MGLTSMGESTMVQQIPVDPDCEVGEGQPDGTMQVAPDLSYQRLLLVNVVYYGYPGAGPGGWVLIDAGVTGTYHTILGAAEKRFGAGSKPAAIVMTHGHFDHVGALKDLAEHWDVPIYAHELELPYLDGRSSYPPPDPTVGGGLMATLSRFYPRGPIDVRPWLRPLPADGSVPGMSGFRWLHTPGHAPGHVSFWREGDRTLIVGDAFITTNQESAYGVLTQEPELHGPPMYYTPDWGAAQQSVERLAALEPELVVTGHGRAMHGPEMRLALRDLARDFGTIAVPSHGRYVDEPAQADESGTTYVPPVAR